MEAKKITVCPHCGRTGLAGNFCSGCAGKLVKECDCITTDARQIADMPKLMKIEYLADPELHLPKKVNAKPEPHRWYWKIKYFVEDYFMLFLSCTCLVFAYLILTR